MACEILRVANSRSGSQLNKVSHKKPGAKTFSKIKLRREDFGKRDALMGRPVPIVLAETGQPFVMGHEGTIKCQLKMKNICQSFLTPSPMLVFRTSQNFVEPLFFEPSFNIKAACESFFKHDQAEKLLHCFPESDWLPLLRIF